MAENKKSFILYADQKELFEQLPDEKAGELIKHIFKYVNDENPITEDLLIKLAFTPIKQHLKRDLEKFEAKKESRSDSGKIGNLRRWHPDIYKKYKKGELTLDESLNIANHRTAIKPIANIAVNDNDNDNVNVNVNDINNISTKVKSIDFDNLLVFINEKFGRGFRVINKDVKAKFKSRLKDGYTKKDIIQAISNASENDFHKDNNYQYCTPEFFSRASTLDKFSEILKPKDKIEDKLLTYASKQIAKYGNS